VAAFCAAIAFANPMTALAQDTTGPSLTAEYLRRFAVAATWPAEVLPDGAPLTICVVGDRAVRDSLERALEGGTIQSRPVAIVLGTPDKPPANCHVLYISAVSATQAQRLVAAVKNAPVLTMSDLERFNAVGGIVEFYYLAGRLRFYISPEAMKVSGVQLPARLVQIGERPR
jgi:hypothetical protein